MPETPSSHVNEQGEALSPQELEALQHFMLSVSVPLLSDTEAGADPVGTGTLFEIAERRFLVTANHHFDDMDVEQLAVPLGRQAAPIKTLGTLTLARPDRPDGPDVAVLELQDGEMAAEIAKHWRFLGREHIGRAQKDATHVVLGYPSALARRDDVAVRQHPLAIYSGLIDPPSPESLKYPLSDWDLFFALEREGLLSDGKVMETPELRGASGAPIFEICGCPDGAWAPEKVLRFVGVQQSELRGEWFRGTRAEVLELYFSKVLAS